MGGVLVLRRLGLVILLVLAWPAPSTGRPPGSPESVTVWHDVPALNVPGVDYREQALCLSDADADQAGKSVRCPGPVGSNPTVEPSPSPTARGNATHRPTASPRPAASESGQTYALAQLGPEQYACLDAIVMHESRWRVDARNPASGAYGIPQALPPEKMASAGADWRTNPVTQVRWMLGYLHGRYGTACAGWAFWQSHRWY